MTVEMTKKIIGFGNPLLDISANVDQAFLDKYGLQADNAILAEEKHLPMYEELVKQHKATFIPGGATQNTMRVLQWLLQETPGLTTMVGCVGTDEYAKTMSNQAEADGVHTAYLHDETTPTGTCAVCITGQNRSMVANLAAANNYKESHLDAEGIWDLVKSADIGYISSFFLTVSPPTIQRVAKHFAESDKLFCMNLSAPFLPQFFKEPMAAALPYCDIVFGNESEAAAYSEANGLGLTDVGEIALKIAALPKEGNTGVTRMVVFTQGPECTVIAKDGKVTKYDVNKLDASEIVDTNAAGDAFVAGFLSQVAKGASVEESVRCGHWAAQLIIKYSGCTFPAKCDFK